MIMRDMALARNRTRLGIPAICATGAGQRSPGGRSSDPEQK
jgi:hypothetical protein